MKNDEKPINNVGFVVSVVATAAAAIVIGIFVPGTPFVKLELSLAYGLLIIMFLFGLFILAGIASGKIPISTIIAEDGGGASMSRFQLLIFTFVIAFSFFLVVAHDHALPDIPANVLALLGISASTYGISKGIQATGGLKGKVQDGNGDGNGTSGSDGKKPTAE
jgi:hypothetical protein